MAASDGSDVRLLARSMVLVVVVVVVVEEEDLAISRVLSDRYLAETLCIHL